jgi:hypothetical protein
MFEHILGLWSQFNDYARLNPVLAGAVSLWVLGVSSYFVKDVPIHIWHFIVSQSTTTLHFDNDQNGWAKENFISFLAWYEKQPYVKWSRSLNMDSIYGSLNDDPVQVGLGEGLHYFIYKGHPFRLSRFVDKTVSDHIVHKIVITMLGRDKKVMRSLIDEFIYKRPEDALSYYTFSVRDGWEEKTTLDHRDFDTVILNREIKKELVSIIKDFQESKDWYKARGFAYKKTFILHGPTGTGKTSIIKALACLFKYNVANINLNEMNDRSLSEAIASAPDKCFILIEDYDSSSATKSRDIEVVKTPEKVNKKEKKSTDAEVMSELRGLTLSGILNALDGIVSMNEKIVWKTTNNLASSDAALTRKGRVDHIFLIDHLTHNEVVDYITLMFPNPTLPVNTVFADIAGCDLQAIYFEHKNSEQDFINAIPVKGQPAISLIA